MKELFEQVIALKNYDLKALLANIDQYHIEGKLTDDEREAMGIENIPDNLDRAVRAMKKDSLIHRTLGSHAFMKYVAYKQKEWNQYRNVVTEWEIKNYLSRY